MFGKLVGTVVGVIIAILIGSIEVGVALALVGGVLGHFLFDWKSTPAKRVPAKAGAPTPQVRAERAEKDLAEKEQLAVALGPIFIEVARSDAETSREEVRVIREFFQHDMKFGKQALGAVSMALKDAMGKPTQDLVQLVTTGRKAVKPADRLKVVDALYAMALVDGALTKPERDALKQVVFNFNLSEEQLQQVTKKHLGSGEKYYALLGLTEAATDDEIRAAWRKLAAENHPDRVASLGKAEAAAASEKFQQVKEAYEELKKLRGL